jgi:hypothetical protein
MASALYPAFKQSMLDVNPSVDFNSDTVRAIFVTTGYTYNTAHNFFDDLTTTQGDGGSGRANGEQLITPTTTNGVLDADDTIFASVTVTAANAIILYKDTGADATSPLVAYIDGISFTIAAGQVTIQWDGGANKIFAL